MSDGSDIVLAESWSSPASQIVLVDASCLVTVFSFELSLSNMFDLPDWMHLYLFSDHDTDPNVNC